MILTKQPNRDLVETYVDYREMLERTCPPNIRSSVHIAFVSGATAVVAVLNKILQGKDAGEMADAEVAAAFKKINEDTEAMLANAITAMIDNITRGLDEGK